MRWCPSPQCSLAIKAERFLDNRQNCTCECGTSFCFNCGESPHDPIPCNLMEEWNKDDNDETIKYFFTNTNECPNCKVVIEKNDGCDHMVSFTNDIFLLCLDHLSVVHRCVVSANTSFVGYV